MLLFRSCLIELLSNIAFNKYFFCIITIINSRSSSCNIQITLKSVKNIRKAFCFKLFFGFNINFARLGPIFANARVKHAAYFEPVLFMKLLLANNKWLYVSAWPTSRLLNGFFRMASYI